MRSLPPVRDPRLLVGTETADDAGVVRLGDGRCLVQTLDFFTPIVDDPYTYGAIAVANSLSDVWAMGGEPLTAMNILCWPLDDLPLEVLEQLLKGADARLREAGVLLVGGHSVRDPELKFGLSVTGLVEEDRIWTNAGARPGDVLVLTKPLGTGIVSTAVKRGQGPPEAEAAAIRSMLAFNREARDGARGLRVHACTDITGNGLAGHAWEVARGSGVRLVLEASRLPLLPHALSLAQAGFVPGGSSSNEAYVGDALQWASSVTEPMRHVILDPQTSGGLLFSLPPAEGALLLERVPAWVVGRVEEGAPVLVVEG